MREQRNGQERQCVDLQTAFARFVEPSYILEHEERELRDLTRFRHKLIQHVGFREKPYRAYFGRLQYQAFQRHEPFER